MLSYFLVFTLGVVATSYGMWLATIYEDKYVIDCIRTMKRQIHLIKSEPRVDMEWFDETLNWSPDDKRIALKSHNSNPSGQDVNTDAHEKDMFEPAPVRPAKAKGLKHVFENSVDKEHVSVCLQNTAASLTDINPACAHGVRLIGFETRDTSANQKVAESGLDAIRRCTEHGFKRDYIPLTHSTNTYERQLKSEIVMFMTRNMNGGERKKPLRGNTVHEFIKAVPPPRGTIEDADDILTSLEKIKVYDDQDCKTYARLVREMYDQVQLLFESEPCRIETPTIQKISVD